MSILRDHSSAKNKKNKFELKGLSSTSKPLDFFVRSRKRRADNPGVQGVHQDSAKAPMQRLRKKTIFSGALRLKPSANDNEHKDISAFYIDAFDYVERLLGQSNTSYSLSGIEQERIPSIGRVIVIADIPRSSTYALTVLNLLSKVRRDIKVGGSDILNHLEPLQAILVSECFTQNNATAGILPEIEQHLKNEGLLLVFPPHKPGRRFGAEMLWMSQLVACAEQSQAPMLPLFMSRRYVKSWVGASRSLIRSISRTGPSAAAEKQKYSKPIPIRIGELIPYSSYRQEAVPGKTQQRLINKHLSRVSAGKPCILTTQSTIAPAEDRRTLITELQCYCELLDTTPDGKRIYLYQHTQGSALLREIGRLREYSFRMVGEGSNHRRDVDAYDRYYQHLILWDAHDLEIAGAYRLGDTRAIVATHGVSGLYSNSLFEFGESMDTYLAKGLELGRSFVQPKYWGKRSLDYLWYGIGALLKQNPDYRYIFGPVSLSNFYPDSAKELIVQFYWHYFGTQEALVTPRLRYEYQPSFLSFFDGNNYKKDFVKLKHILAGMGLSIPTLYKQYAELYQENGVHFMGFNVDPDFAYCVDAFVMADITKIKEKKYQRYIARA